MDQSNSSSFAKLLLDEGNSQPLSHEPHINDH